MGLFGPNKKNRFVEDVPGETAQDRLQHYIQASAAPPDKRAAKQGKNQPRDLVAAPDPAPSKKVTDAEYAPLATASTIRPRESQIHDLELRDPDDDHAHHPRSFADKMFHLSVYGWIQLAFISLVVGAIIQSGGINPFGPDFSWSGAAASAWKSAVSLLGWAFDNAWLPLVTGMIVVAPIWLVWRLATVPFRH